MSAPRGKKAEELGVAARGSALEARRRLGPLGRGLRAFLGRIAPPISGGLVFLLRLFAAALIAILRVSLRLIAAARARLVPLAGATGHLIAARVTPVATVALVAAGAAVALGISQFLDYRGVAVGGELYEGEVGSVAPAPLTDTEHTGAAHLYLGVPLAVAALVLIGLTASGRWRLGRLIGLVGLLGLILSVAIDAPKGLDAGNAGFAFASSNVELLRGFWIQLVCSAALLILGPLLGSYVRATTHAKGRRRPRRSLETARGAPASLAPPAERFSVPGSPPARQKRSAPGPPRRQEGPGFPGWQGGA